MLFDQDINFHNYTEIYWDQPKKFHLLAWAKSLSSRYCIHATDNDVRAIQRPICVRKNPLVWYLQHILYVNMALSTRSIRSYLDIEYHFNMIHALYILRVVHYSDVIMGTMALKSPVSRLFTQPFIQAQIKENTKAPRHWPLCGEFIGNRWMSHTNGQWRGNVSIWWRHHGSISVCFFSWIHCGLRSHWTHHLFRAKSFSAPMDNNYWMDPLDLMSVIFNTKYKNLHTRKKHLKKLFAKWRLLFLGHNMLKDHVSVVSS